MDLLLNLKMPFFLLVPKPRHMWSQQWQRNQRLRRAKGRLVSMCPPHLTPWTRPAYTPSPTMWHRGTAHTNNTLSLTHTHTYLYSSLPHWPKHVRAEMELILTPSHMGLVIVVQDSDLIYTDMGYKRGGVGFVCVCVCPCVRNDC